MIEYLIPGIVLVCGLIVDRVIGDPQSRFHPVAMIGMFIGWWGKPKRYQRRYQRTIGIVMWVITISVFTAPFFVFQLFSPVWLYLIAAPFFLNSCFAVRSLEEHAQSVHDAVSLAKGQQQAALLVSRDTSGLSHEEVLSAAYESVAENLNDSIIAPLFYFVIFGLPGSALYRAANTMDAMLGYRDERILIGWFAARADDVLSYIPARVTGLLLLVLFTIKGRYHEAYTIYSQHRKRRSGYNGGIPMALIAGGVGVMFEKQGVYQIGVKEHSLTEAGSDIINTVRITTLLFTFFTVFVLLLLNQFSNM